LLTGNLAECLVSSPSQRFKKSSSILLSKARMEKSLHEAAPEENIRNSKDKNGRSTCRSAIEEKERGLKEKDTSSRDTIEKNIKKSTRKKMR
jgi:hypothetical protein